MRRGLYFIVLFVIFLMLSAAFRPSAGPIYVENEVLVKFKPTTSAVSLQSLLTIINSRTLAYMPEIGVRRIRLPDTLTVSQAVARLTASGLVEYAEPNYLCHAFTTPNDPLFSRLWALQNTGQDGGSSGADIGATKAWDIDTGQRSVIIGIIDSGIDYTHDDLKAAVYTNPGEDPWSDPNNPTTGNHVDDDHNGYIDDWKGWNFVKETNDPMDDNSHGSHCAGTIGAVGNNSTGITGICWNVQLLPLKFLNAEGSGYTGDAVQAITYATNLGAKILNNSWGSNEYSNALLDAINYAHQKGVLVVAAAGNDGINTDVYPNYPSCYDAPNIISVAASDNKDERAVWGSEDNPSDNCGFTCNNVMAAVPGSNYGSTTVDLAAPGSGIWSTVPGGYARFDGTSMATPHVCGVAGLVWSHFPSLTNVQVRERILANVDPLSSWNGLVATNGRLNAWKALQ